MARLKDLERTKAQWENNALRDPLWSVLHTSRGSREWDIDDFFHTGTTEVTQTLDEARAAGHFVDETWRALDFGCGVGRLTQAIAARFSDTVGVDIAPQMVELANRYNKYPRTCHYHVIDGADLSDYEDESFGLIYSSIVLQHVPKALASVYLSEFCRLLRPEGLIVFQVPSHARLRQVDRLARASQSWPLMRRPLERAGLISRNGYRADMHCMTPSEVRSALDAVGCRVIRERLTNSTASDAGEGFRYLESEPRTGYVSVQYFATRDRCGFEKDADKGE